MAMTPEVKVKHKVRTILTEMQAYWAVPVTGGYGASGVPDILVCLDGFFIGIECKAGKGKVTALQQMNLDNIEKAGGLALVINETNVSQLKELIMTWINTVRTEMLTNSQET
jgi:hypothetical protein